MADTSIEWTNKSWNPIAAYFEGKRGWMCSKPSPGCKHCYSERLNLRLGNGLRYTPESVGKVEWRLVNLDEPLKWRKPQMIFVCSMTDLFHEAIPFEYIGAVFGVMMATKQHTYQVLTKRPERALEFFDWLSARALGDELTEREEVEQNALQHVDACHLKADTSQWPLPNVWIGVSVENQEQADNRLPHLLGIPAAVRFLSVEPLLGPIDLRLTVKFLGGSEALKDFAADLHQVIIGGESGPGARPMQREWVDSLIAQCRRAGVRPGLVSGNHISADRRHIGAVASLSSLSRLGLVVGIRAGRGVPDADCRRRLWR